MSDIFFAFGLGIVFGIIDIIPMVIKKMSKHYIASAFVQWVFLGVVIYNLRLFGLQRWISGAVVAVFAALPIVILIVREDRKAVGIILGTSLVLGALLGAAAEYCRLYTGE